MNSSRSPTRKSRSPIVNVRNPKHRNKVRKTCLLSTKKFKDQNGVIYTLPAEILRKIATEVISHDKKIYDKGSSDFYKRYKRVMSDLRKSIQWSLVNPGWQNGIHLLQRALPLEHSSREKALKGTLRYTGYVDKKGVIFQKILNTYGAKHDCPDDDYIYREGFLDALISEMEAEIIANRA